MIRTLLGSALVALVGLVTACSGDSSSNGAGGTDDALVNKGQCQVTGCSGQLCASESTTSDCAYREEYACYSTAVCERQTDGACGWTQTSELAACLGIEDPDGGADADTEPLPACIVSGCNGQVCAERQVITTCEYRAEYACYRSASCTRQDAGACGWTATPELTACLGR